MKTSDLIGPALDREVSKLEGWAQSSEDGFWRRGTHKRAYAPEYSKQWMWGGPIIEREGILLRPLRREGHALDGLWLAMFDASNTGTMVQWVKRTDWVRHYLEGPTPLIAAMRCYVASRLGDEVDVPKELL